MKKLLLGAAAMVAVATPAMAQFTKVEPPTLNDETALECAIVGQTHEVDRDPVYKIEIDLRTDKGDISSLFVRHTTVSGAAYVRSDQYKNGSIWQSSERMEWYWRGSRGPATMLGEVWHNDRGWWYSEVIFRNDRPDYKMISSCHVVPGEDAM